MDKAFEAQKKACDITPNSVYYSMLVRILYLSKRFDEAKEYLEELKKYSMESHRIEKERLEEAEQTAARKCF